MMARIEAEISSEIAKQMDRMVREGWYPSSAEIVQEALVQFVEGRTYLGDSPRMLHRFAADALNESKPDTALKFADRGLGLVLAREPLDYALYQALLEIRVQILLVLNRAEEALMTLEEARDRLPNNPGITRWINRLKKAAPKES